jgi:RNA polymerase sigma factor (sigma-70 family)
MPTMTDEQKKLVEDNLNLARHLAYKFIIKGTYNFTYDEIFSLFSFALCKASIAFDLKNGVKFSSYACRCMVNELGMAFRRKTTSRENETYALDAVLSEDNEGNKASFLDYLYSDGHVEYEKVENLMTLKEALKSLEEKELMIISLRYFNEDNHASIGKKLNISRCWASRLEQRILEKLRNYFAQ